MLANDLSGCMGEGLIVGAPNIVVDLNGHTITSGLALDPGDGGRALRRRPQRRPHQRRHQERHRGRLRLRRHARRGHDAQRGRGLDPHRQRARRHLPVRRRRRPHRQHRPEQPRRPQQRDRHPIDSESENSLIEDNTFIGNGMSIPRPRLARPPDRGQRHQRRGPQPAARQRRRHRARGLEPQRHASATTSPTPATPASSSTWRRTATASRAA